VTVRADLTDRPLDLLIDREPAVLVLEDGRTFAGESFGAIGQTVGEAVFATGMTGYQETLTDPSYHRQVVVMTAPHIGNTGLNDEDSESTRIWVAGYVVRDPALRPSSWRSRRPLEQGQGDIRVIHLEMHPAQRVRNHRRLVRQSIGLFGHRQGLCRGAFLIGQDVREVVQGSNMRRIL